MADKFEQLHGEAHQDTRFVDATVAAVGLEPASARWDKLSLPGRSLLEIGPGTGHLLAAAHKAGRSVAAVESSKVHRTFINDDVGHPTRSYPTSPPFRQASFSTLSWQSTYLSMYTT